MERKDFLKASGLVVAGLGAGIKASAKKAQNIAGTDDYAFDMPPINAVCTLVPTETIGPFPSLPSGDAMYWRSNIVDGMVGVPLTFTIRLYGTANCGVLAGRRIDVWQCNAHGYYSHFAASGINNGHSGQSNPGSTNASLIYGRGSQVTNANGEVTYTSIFPGWYPGRTMHIHFAIYSGGTVGTSNGWTLDRISQFTFPVAAKNTLLTSNAPYSIYGADPLLPENDNIFNTPTGEWSTLQLATLSGSGAGPYTSLYEVAITASGILPLKLLGFDGSAYGQSCLLRWKTEAETAFSHFELEYSADADDFDFLARINSRSTNTSGQNDYVYEDKDRLISGNAFYRLKMIDIDGKTSYSSIVAIHNNNRLPIKINANPVTTNHLILQHPVSSGHEKIMITDSVGRSIGVGTLAVNDRVTKVDISLCSKGVHFLIYSDGKFTQTLKFLIQ